MDHTRIRKYNPTMIVEWTKLASRGLNSRASPSEIKLEYEALDSGFMNVIKHLQQFKLPDYNFVYVAVGSANNDDQIKPKFVKDAVEGGGKVFVINIDPYFRGRESFVEESENVLELFVPLFFVSDKDAREIASFTRLSPKVYKAINDLVISVDKPVVLASFVGSGVIFPEADEISKYRARQERTTTFIVGWERTENVLVVGGEVCIKNDNKEIADECLRLVCAKSPSKSSIDGITCYRAINDIPSSVVGMVRDMVGVEAVGGGGSGSSHPIGVRSSVANTIDTARIEAMAPEVYSDATKTPKRNIVHGIKLPPLESQVRGVDRDAVTDSLDDEPSSGAGGLTARRLLPGELTLMRSGIVPLPPAATSHSSATAPRRHGRRLVDADGNPVTGKGK